MGFDVGTLDDLANAIGAEVPNGDPDAIFALANQIEAKADAWDGHADELARLKAQLRSALAGDTAEAHDQKLAELLHGPDSLSGDSAAVRAGVAGLRNYAADLQDNQWTSRLLAAWLLATMLWGAASVIATGGESLVEVAVAKVRTAAAINALKEVLWRRIATILTEMLINAGKGMLLGGAEQLVVQGLQVATGERTSLNGQLIAGTGLSFAEFGAGEQAVEHGVLDLVGDAAKDSRAASVAAWATSKVLSGIGGNTVATAAAGGPITPETVLTGAAMGAAGGLAEARGKGTTATTGAASVPEPTHNAAARTPIDTHPTLRFEKQPDGTFAWPGETTHDAGPHAHTAPATAPTTEPATAAGEHSAGAPAHALPAHADPRGRPVEATTTTPPAAADAGHLPATRVAAGLDAPPAAHASVDSHLPEGMLDLSTDSPAAHRGPLTATTSPKVSLPPPASNAVSPATPAAPTAAGPPPAQTVPSAPSPPPPAPSSPPTPPGPNAEPSSPTPGPHAGPAGSRPLASEALSQPGALAAGRVDTTATPDARTHDTAADQAASVQPVGVDPGASAGRSGADAHLLARSEGTRADSGRATDPLTTRRDPARPAGPRDDSNRPSGARPDKLPRRSSVARDVPKDLQPTAATRAQNPLAAAKDIGVIEAHRDDSGPGPGQPDTHQGGHVSSDDQNTPDPTTAGGGGDYRGGDGDNRGGAGGHGGGGRGAGHGGAGPGDGSGAGDPPDRGDGGNRDGDGGGDRDGGEDHGAAADHASSDVEAQIPPKPGPLEPYGWMTDEAWRRHVLEQRHEPAIPPKPGPGEPYGWMSDDEWRQHVLERRDQPASRPAIWDQHQPTAFDAARRLIEALGVELADTGAGTDPWSTVESAARPPTSREVRLDDLLSGPSSTVEDGPWSSAEAAAQEIQSRRQPVSYAEILGSARVVLVGEEHLDSSISEHLMRHAEQIAGAGITDYGIEFGPASQPGLDALNRGESVDVRLGPELDLVLGPGGGFARTHLAGHERVVRALSAHGVRVITVDLDFGGKGTSIEAREQHITDRIMGVLEQDPDARILVLIGALHTGKLARFDGSISARAQLEAAGIAAASTRVRLDQAGIAAVSVNIVGGSQGPHSASQAGQRVSEAALLAGASRHEFMLDMRPNDESTNVPPWVRNTDYVIHTPQLGPRPPTPHRAPDITPQEPTPQNPSGPGKSSGEHAGTVGGTRGSDYRPADHHTGSDIGAGIPPKPGPGEPYAWMSDKESQRHIRVELASQPPTSDRHQPADTREARIDDPVAEPADTDAGAGTDPWSTVESAAREIQSHSQPVSYAEILGSGRVVMIGENHSDAGIREHLVRHAEQIAGTGITHYGIEVGPASQPALDTLNRGESVDLSRVRLGPGADGYEQAVRALSAHGVKVVAIDQNPAEQGPKEEREQYITDQIMGVLEQDPDARILVLIGGFHTTKQPSSFDGFKYAAARLNEAGIPTASVQIAGGSTGGGGTFLSDAVGRAGVAGNEFMLDMRPYADSPGIVPFGAGNTDYVIHIPRTESSGSWHVGATTTDYIPRIESPRSFPDSRDVLAQLLEQLAQRGNRELRPPTDSHGGLPTGRDGGDGGTTTTSDRSRGPAGGGAGDARGRGGAGHGIAAPGDSRGAGDPQDQGDGGREGEQTAPPAAHNPIIEINLDDYGFNVLNRPGDPRDDGGGADDGVAGPGDTRDSGKGRDGESHPAVDSVFGSVSGDGEIGPPGGFVAEFGRNDEPISPLTHVKPSSECLTDYETNRALHWSRFAADRKLSLDQFIAQADDHAAELVRNSYVCTRVTGPTLQKVLDSGEFKSFFDTGETSIFDHQLEEYVPSHMALFGYGGDLAPEGRPIYGYITRDPLGRDLYGGRLSGYGTAAVVFKPEVAERTTITLNDSLAVATHNDEMKVGMSFADPLTNPTSNLFRRNEDPFRYQNPESVKPYVEAQIHRLTSAPSGTELSPLRIDSIDRVTFLSDRSEYPPELFDTLDSRGIPYSFSQDPPAEPTIGVDVDFV